MYAGSTGIYTIVGASLSEPLINGTTVCEIYGIYIYGTSVTDRSANVTKFSPFFLTLKSGMARLIKSHR